MSTLSAVCDMTHSKFVKRSQCCVWHDSFARGMPYLHLMWPICMRFVMTLFKFGKRSHCWLWQDSFTCGVTYSRVTRTIYVRLMMTLVKFVECSHCCMLHDSFTSDMTRLGDMRLVMYDWKVRGARLLLHVTWLIQRDIFTCNMPNPHETHHDFLQNWEVLSLLHVTRRFHEWREVFTSDATHSQRLVMWLVTTLVKFVERFHCFVSHLCRDVFTPQWGVTCSEVICLVKFVERLLLSVAHMSLTSEYLPSPPTPPL